MERNHWQQQLKKLQEWEREIGMALAETMLCGEAEVRAYTMHKIWHLIVVYWFELLDPP